MRYSLAVVRLADASHAQLASLKATAGGMSARVCGPATAVTAGSPAAAPGPAAGSNTLEAGSGGSAPAPGGEALEESVLGVAEDYGPCEPNAVAQLNVTSGTAYLSLHPGLRFPNIQVCTWVLQGVSIQ